MKKTYINPEMEIVKIATHQQMLTVSNRGIANENAGVNGDGDYNDAHLFDGDDW